MISVAKYLFNIRKKTFFILSFASLLLLGGCAQFPEHEKPLEITKIDQLGSKKSFSVTTITWPQEQWWRSYGDAQLDLLIGEALRDSPNLAIAEARLRQAQAVSQMMGAARVPQVSANLALTEAQQSYNYIAPRVALPQGWNDYGQGTLNFAWELDFWGKNRSALAAAISGQQAAQAEVEQARLMLATTVASAYAGLANLNAVRDTVVSALDLRTKTTELFRQRNKFGLETLGSLRQVEARQAATEAELLAIDEQLALQKNGIAALLGAGPDRGLAIARPALSFNASAGMPSQLALELLGRRPDIVAARLRTESAASRIDQQKAGFYPSVNLMGYVGYQSLGINNLTNSGSLIGSVGPAISLPIFNTRSLQGQLRGAHAEYDMAVSGYNATLTNALREVADAAVSRKSLGVQLAALRKSVAAAEEAQGIITHRYQGDLSSYLDVLSAEDALLSSKRALAEMESRALVLEVALVRALGGGYQMPEDAKAKSGTDE